MFVQSWGVDCGGKLLDKFDPCEVCGGGPIGQWVKLACESLFWHFFKQIEEKTTFVQSWGVDCGGGAMGTAEVQILRKQPEAHREWKSFTECQWKREKNF